MRKQTQKQSAISKNTFIPDDQTDAFALFTHNKQLVISSYSLVST